MKYRYFALLFCLSYLSACHGEPENETGGKCSILTKEYVSGLNGTGIDEAFLDCINEKFGTDHKKSYEVVMSLPRVYQVVYITWLVEAEVNNGGFNQYFWNPSGEFADEAPNAFKEIGAKKHEELMMRAVKRAIDSLPINAKYIRKGTIEAFSESYKEAIFDDLDKEFYQISEDAQALREKYVKSNLSQFL